MPALPEAVVLALALLALWTAQHGAFVDGDAPLDDAVLQALA